ncbi:MAG: transposase [Candidatus Micrarchaeaceae archaeon]
MGPITGTVILGKICNIYRFENAEKLVAFSGIDPVMKENGKQRSQKSISKRGDSALRSAIYQSTLAAVRMNPVISEFYHRKVDGGMPKKKALVAASRKLCHIMWSVWHNNRPFEIPEKFRKQE